MVQDIPTIFGLYINVQQPKKIHKKLTGKSYKDFPVGIDLNFDRK